MAKKREEFKDEASLIRERRDASSKWMNENYWAEFVQVYRASKCLTEPIMRKNKAGKKVEDKTRTNVAMPDISRVIRQNTARLTANPPLLNYLAPDQSTAIKLTGWRYQQFDRSGENAVRRMHVQQEETFGFSVTKSYYDKITATRTFRRPSNKWDRALVMEARGAQKPDIDAAVQQYGPQLSDPEMADAISEFGSELSETMDLTKYEGPRCKFVFIGDFYPEPGFSNLHDGWMVEEYVENDAWLENMLTKTYNNEDGEEMPVFDKAAVAKLEDDDSFDYSDLSRYAKGLKTQLRAAIGQSDLSVNSDRRRLQKGKRYRIFENHEEIDGRWYITWIGNGQYTLGKMCYQWDLGGRSLYTPFVGLPDLLVGIGDSTPRMMRFLYNLHNATVGSRQDLVNSLLRRTVFRSRNADIPDEAVERANFRILDVKSASDFVIPNEPDVPPSAFETEAAIMRQMASLEPSLFSTDSGTAGNPLAGKLATTAVLSQRANDALLQFKLDQLALYDKELAEKDLLMLQAEMQEPQDIHKRYAKTEAMQQMYGEKASVISLDPYEIQEDIEVEPAVGSTLSQDDEFHRMAWERLYQLAEQDPIVWNKTEVAKGYAACIRGADATKLLNPPAPMPPPPPKITFAITAKWEQLPSELKQQLIEGQGIQLTPELVQELQSQDQLQSVKELGDAAEAAGKLAEPADDQAAKAQQDSAATAQQARHDSIHAAQQAGHDIAKAKVVAKSKPKGQNGSAKPKAN